MTSSLITTNFCHVIDLRIYFTLNPKAQFHGWIVFHEIAAVSGADIDRVDAEPPTYAAAHVGEGGAGNSTSDREPDEYPRCNHDTVVPSRRV